MYLNGGIFVENLKKFFSNIFLYKKSNPTHDFSLLESPNEHTPIPNDINDTLALPEENIFPNINDNLNYLKVRYNSLINSDVIIRGFTLVANNKKYNALLVCIDGMINSDLINNFTLKPLMQKNKISRTKKLPTNVKQNSKFDLETYLYNTLIPQNSITKVTAFKDLISQVNEGCCAILVDTLSVGFVIDVKGFSARSISAPNNEIIIRGSQEAFVEKIRTNTTMLRRIINNENLIMENASVGKITHTQIAICYMKNITNNDLVAEVKYRVNNLDIDSLVSSGQLEQLIQDNPSSAFPQMIATERPDKTAEHILNGRVAILVNGSPYALIAPGILIDYLSSPEDINLKNHYSNLLKFLRILSTLITLLLPAIYISIVTFHSELLPTELLFTIAASRNSVPFPVIFEILLMEISFELIREAGLRVPTPLGTTIGIVGALILGEAAVSASLVSPILIIIVAITGICSFAIPDFSLSFALRIFRFAYIILGYMLGFLGLALGLFIQLAILSNLKSFGVPYLAPYIPSTNKSNSVSYFLKPLWKDEYRPDFLNPKRKQQEPETSLKWKFSKGR